MTIKEIAEICNVSESTVRSWIGRTAESAALSAKIALCRGKEPARLALDETLTIIRAGGRSTLADLLAENARTSTNIAIEQSRQFATIISEMVPAMAAAVAATAVKTALLQQSPVSVRTHQGQLALPAATLNGDYYTIKGYGSRRGLRINKNTAVTLGREASKLSRQRNTDIRRVADEEWGEINAYYISILKEVFTV